MERVGKPLGTKDEIEGDCTSWARVTALLFSQNSQNHRRKFVVRTYLRSLRKELQTGCLMSLKWLVQDVQTCSGLRGSQQPILGCIEDIQTSKLAATLLEESTHHHLGAVTSLIQFCRGGFDATPPWARFGLYMADPRFPQGQRVSK